MSVTVQELLGYVREYHAGLIDGLELIFLMEEAADTIAYRDHICLRCKCYKDIVEIVDRHPYGDTYTKEISKKWVCPICGEDD